MWQLIEASSSGSYAGEGLPPALRRTDGNAVAGASTFHKLADQPVLLLRFRRQLVFIETRQPPERAALREDVAKHLRVAHRSKGRHQPAGADAADHRLARVAADRSIARAPRAAAPGIGKPAKVSLQPSSRVRTPGTLPTKIATTGGMRPAAWRLSRDGWGGQIDIPAAVGKHQPGIGTLLRVRIPGRGIDPHIALVLEQLA